MQGRLFSVDLSFFGGAYVIPAPSYFVLLLTGFLFATVMGAIWAKRVGQDPDVIVDLGLAMLLAGVAGKHSENPRGAPYIQFGEWIVEEKDRPAPRAFAERCRLEHAQRDGRATLLARRSEGTQFAAV